MSKQYTVAVTNPEGRTRYVGKTHSPLWVDSVTRAARFENASDAQGHIDNPFTAANSRLRAGWSVQVQAAA